MTKVQGGLFEILDKIKARPGLYIGRPSVSDLFMFLVGYKTARRELGIEPNQEEVRFYQDFHQFVEKKYNLHSSNTWAKVIMLYCPNEKQGFERFFQLLGEFQQEQQTVNSDGVEEVNWRCLSKDPFDHLLIAQAITENLPILSRAVSK